MGLQVGILGLGIEAGTFLADVGEVAVAEDLGIGIVDFQGPEQGIEGGLLFEGTGVLGTSLGVESSLVADADAVLVVVAGMGTGEVLMTGLVELSVPGDVIVVAGEAETGLVAGDELGDREGPVAARGATVNDDEVNATHLKN